MSARKILKHLTAIREVSRRDSDRSHVAIQKQIDNINEILVQDLHLLQECLKTLESLQAQKAETKVWSNQINYPIKKLRCIIYGHDGE
ncbi:MAG: hypothetical protein F6K36_13830 [Symploca sp. SIO3C6]|uniref:Uncharacterized protein n=1 Tax=Symploca sp. SIO1C4 TaxID=2607765 RepID=A0A6B3NII2_9CYAN|nr:hypothetical protein [Symploca sp. SIO3C6]NER29471.1 hypothetical protein [Symploca sp. SIO1C4]NET07190.1 hypothetical protein [Symploca sp. SIO2B6]